MLDITHLIRFLVLKEEIVQETLNLKPGSCSNFVRAEKQKFYRFGKTTDGRPIYKCKYFTLCPPAWERHHI